MSGDPTAKVGTEAANRAVSCARCGVTFECGLSGQCWCAAEPYRLRMTDRAAQSDCLCQSCLRNAAMAQGAVGAG
jgi:hypothetical protein